MKLITPSFEIITQDTSCKTQYKLLAGVYKHIELCGRTCYKSTDLITEDSAKPFVDRMIKSKHYAMLEHGTIYLAIPYSLISRIFHPFMCNKYEHNNYSYCKVSTEYMVSPVTNEVTSHKMFLVTTNLRVLVENDWLDDIQYICSPTKNHIMRRTVKFICNRQVSHEFVRHRVFSFAQESTRYCNYCKDKFGSELTFIKPVWTPELDGPESYYDMSDAEYMLLKNLEHCEKTYQDLISKGWKPQQAATILPNALKTELIMTGIDDDWSHFFDLRALGTTGAPHPQAKELAMPLMLEFVNREYINYNPTNNEEA